MTLSKKLLAAFALVATASSAAVAQTDFGSPLGAGAGVGGAVAPLGHPGGGGGSGGGLSGNGMSGLANARASFMNAGAGGVSIPNPAGGTVNLSQSLARALAAVMGGNPTPAQVSELTAAIGGSGAAGLVQALTALGRGASMAALGSAVRAFNGAVDGTPAGSTPSPALLAVRQALAAASRQ
jgi:hypothetical protein